MNEYGNIAVQATALVEGGAFRTPGEAWLAAAKLVFPMSGPSQTKSCPRGAYLGLCEEGLVRGVPRGSYTTSQANKEYAVEAVRLLVSDPTLADTGMDDGGAKNLWRKVMRGRNKDSNHQMEVVLGLWTQDLIDWEALR